MSDSSQTSAIRNTPILEARALHVSIAGVTLLCDVAFTVRRGELLGLMAPSGWGKTTLLRVLAGLIDGGTGRILLRGTPPAHYGWPAFRRRVVLVNQKPALLDTTVAENLKRPFEYASASTTYPEPEAKRLLNAFHLSEEVLAQQARTLSVGQQQRVCLVRALLLEPDVLLLDEPTSALDEDAAAAVEATIRRQAEDQGLTALVVSHDRAQMARWCTRTLELAEYACAESAP